MLGAGVETIEYRRKLSFDVGECQVFLVKQISALLAVPLKSVELTGPSSALDDQTYGASRTLRRMRDARRQEQNLTGAYGQIANPAVLGHPKHHISFELVEKLFGGIDVEIASSIGTTDGHHDKFTVLKYELVAHGRFEQ